MVEEARGINALELGITLFAFPIRAGNIHQFEGGDALGGRDVRAPAEIDKFSSGVERNHRLGGFFFDELTLENLIGFFVEIESFGLRNEFALVGEVLGGKLVHFGFDFGEVFRSERFLAEEFVEEAGVNGRADAEFYVGV